MKLKQEFPSPGTLIERYNNRRLGTTRCEQGLSRPHYFHGNNPRVAKKRERFVHEGVEHDVMTPLPPRIEKVALELFADEIEEQMQQKVNRASWGRG